MAHDASWTHEQKAPLTGSPEQVFAALTDASQLRRWFAEHVDVEPRVGGSYRFWGKHTYGTPSASQAQQRITDFDPGKRLTFSWRFEGIDSLVTYDLAADEQSSAAQKTTKTTLRVHHAFADRLNVPYSVELVDDLWRFTLGNLTVFLDGGHGIVLPDFTDPRPAITLSLVIHAPRERVFRALTDPDTMNRWISKAAAVDLREGGRYTYGWQYEHGGRSVEGGPTRILEMVPNERLVTDWLDWRGDTTRPATRITWLLEDAGNATRVTLIHDGFSRVVDQSDYPFGWTWFLDRLKEAAEGRPVVPMASLGA